MSMSVEPRQPVGTYPKICERLIPRSEKLQLANELKLKFVLIVFIGRSEMKRQSRICQVVVRCWAWPFTTQADPFTPCAVHDNLHERSDYSRSSNQRSRFMTCYEHASCRILADSELVCVEQVYDVDTGSNTVQRDGAKRGSHLEKHWKEMRRIRLID